MENPWVDGYMYFAQWGTLWYWTTCTLSHPACRNLQITHGFVNHILWAKSQFLLLWADKSQFRHPNNLARWTRSTLSIGEPRWDANQVSQTSPGTDWYLDADCFSDNSFRFIAIQSPAAAKDPTTRRLARSHAIKQAIKAKRELQEKQNVKSAIITHEGHPNRTADHPSPTTSALSPSNKLFDLQTIDASRLKTLIKQSKLELHWHFFSSRYLAMILTIISGRFGKTSCWACVQLKRRRRRVSGIRISIPNRCWWPCTIECCYAHLRAWSGWWKY